jgi:ABC1 atypical kinase-like domain
MRQHLLDRCPVSSWAEVARTVREDLGAPPEVLFASFDRVPIASASLAQVHVARGHDGRKLAVKVQHAGLRESCTADVATIEFLVAAARRVFPDFDYSWLVCGPCVCVCVCVFVCICVCVCIYVCVCVLLLDGCSWQGENAKRKCTGQCEDDEYSMC